MDLITLAIPFFFALMGIEAGVSVLRGRGLYRARDVFTCLALGTLQTLFGVVAAVVLTGLYQWVYAHRAFTLPDDHAAVWIFAFVGVDFCYYWFHRASHRMMLTWATHAPHHSSEHYNFAVALRQGPIQPLASRFFYLPLAWLGVSFETFVVLVSINTLYQFWIHTELVRRLGPLEWFLNTPSHHRVHHGCNGRYLDKNHGGIFIVWDRLFGTFVAEDDHDPPVFGTVTPLSTWNPLVASWVPFSEIVQKAKAGRGVVDVVKAVVAPPEWLPAAMAPGAPVTGKRRRFSDDIRAASLGVRVYVVVAFVGVLVLAVAYLLRAHALDGLSLWVGALWLTASFGSLGAVLDGWRFAPVTEAARWCALVGVVGWLSFSA